MSIVGEATGVFGLLRKAQRWVCERLDPARAQAHRFIAAFEAYGIARQQIARLLPSEIKLPNASFSTPDKLKDQVTPELLDWAAGYLCISRAWLDGVAEMPHLLQDHYKSPGGYLQWLSTRLVHAPNVGRWMHIWKPEGQALGPNEVGYGPLCLVYEEISVGLDGTELSRYWLLSDHWSLDHAPCIENLLAVIAICQSFDVWVLGNDVPVAVLLQMQAGKKYIPEVAKQRRGKWYPEDLIRPLAGQDSEWRRAAWRGAQDYLASAGIPREPCSTASEQQGRKVP